ncbi:MAG: hypothetical protein GWP08_14370 [Nitrospiraceae bacterium]|nr:hypothetical protein [Nitrospiraceae bacterium]
MPVKYICQECGKRFVDWGAEKLGYRCPDCKDSELVRASEHQAAKPKKPKPSLKRKPRKNANGEAKAKKKTKKKAAKETVGKDSL